MNSKNENTRVVAQDRVTRDSVSIHDASETHVNLIWVLNVFRWQASIVLAVVMLFSSVQATGQVTFGSETIGNITAEVGELVANRQLPAATGGTLPYTYSLVGLPSGLNFNPSDRIFGGTPTSIVSTSNYTYTVQDNVGATASINFHITVNAATELRVTSTGGDYSITLNWYGLGTADSYCIKHKLASSSNFSTCTTVQSNGAEDLLSHTIQNLELATQYSVFVEAYNSLNSPIGSTTILASTRADESPRFEPTAHISEISVRAGLMLFTVSLPAATGGNGAISYEIDPTLPDGLTLQSNRQITGTPTTPQSTRRYLYKAVDADGDYSALAFNLTIEDRVPITGLKTTAGNGSVTVEWNAVPNAASYIVRYRERGSTAAWSEAFTGSSPVTLSGLTNDQAYVVRVVVLDSQSHEFTYADTTATPGSASQIVVTATGGDGEVLVSWTAVEFAQRYRIRYRLSTSTSSFNAGAFATSVPEGGFKVSNLALNTEYRVQVDAFGATNNLLSSDSDTARTLDDTSPTFGSAVISPITIYLGQHVEATLPPHASGGNQPFVYSITPLLPAGLTFDSDTRTISGIPTSSAIASSYIYRVRDLHGDTASIAFSFDLRSFFTRIGSGASVLETNPDFSNVNDALVRDRVIPDGSTVEPRDVVYRLDALSATTFVVTASTANHKAPILALAQGKTLDFEKGPRVHQIRIISTSESSDGGIITLGVYTVTLTVLNVDEPPQKSDPPNVGEPDQVVYTVGDGLREFVLSNRFFDPEQLPVTIDMDGLRITNEEGTIVYASGSSASTIAATDQVVKAEIVGDVLLRVRVDTSQIRRARSITNDVRVTARDQGNLESEEFVVRFNVKIGANNPPVFIGGATAVSSTVLENTEHVGTFYATDLDDHARSNGAHNDSLTFSIQGATRQPFWDQDVLLLNGSCLYVNTTRDDPNDRWVATVRSVVPTDPTNTSQCRRGFDFEQMVTPRFVLEVSDGFGGKASVAVTIYVENIDEPASHEISNLPQFQLHIGGTKSVDLNSFINDPENAELSFIVNTFDPQVATVDETEGVLTVTAVGAGRTTLSVTYLDSGGHTGSFQVAVVVKLSQYNNEPQFLREVGAVGYEVDENSPGGTGIGVRNIATDSDVHDVLTYSIDTYNDVFDVSSERGSEGQLSLKPEATLNFEEQNSYSFTLTVEDGWGGSDTLEITITVNDVNEPPYLNPANTSNGRIDEVRAPIGEDFEYDISQYFLDEDAADEGRLRYRVSITNRLIASVQIAATGVMLVEGKRLGSIEVTVTTTDTGGHRVMLSFTLSVVENSLPVVRNPIPDQKLAVGEFVDIPLSDVFYDSDGDVAVIKAEESDDSVVLAILTKNNTELALFGYSVGVADVTVIAADPAGGEVEDEFIATVSQSAASGRPRLANRIGDQTITAGIERTVDLNEVFAFDDASFLTEINVHSTNSDIANGEVDLTTMTLNLHGYKPGEVYVTLVASTKEGARIGDFFTTYVETTPEVVATITDVDLEVGGNSLTVDFSHVFVDRDGDDLRYAIEIQDSSFVNLSRIGTKLKLLPVRRGTTTVTVSATDPKGRMATLSFGVSVGNEGLRMAAEKSLTNYSRTLLASASAAIDTRVSADAQSSDDTVSSWLESMIRQDGVGKQSGLQKSGMRNEETAEAFGLENPTIHSFRTPRSFALGFGGEQSSWSFWGYNDQQHLEGDTARVESRSRFLGVDIKANDRWVLGVALAKSSGETDFQFGSARRDMTIQSSMVIPYVSYDISSSRRVWSMIGKGRGSIEIADAEQFENTPLVSDFLLIGGRQALAQYCNLDFALRGDHAQLKLRTRGGSGAVSGLNSSIERTRIGIQTSASFQTYLGSIRPAMDVGVRHDGGMHSIGSGIEVAVGLNWSLRNFIFETTIRGIRTGGTLQSSTSMTFGLKPNSQGTGLTLKLEPTWGSLARSNELTFADGDSFRRVSDGLLESDSSRAITTEVSYGFRFHRDIVLLHPFFRYEEEYPNYKLGLIGARFSRKVDFNDTLQVELAFGANTDRRAGITGSVLSARASFRF